LHKKILNNQILSNIAIRVAVVATLVVTTVAVQDGSALAGTRIVVRAQNASKLGFPAKRSAEMRALESRINASGIASATVQAKGRDEIVIELPSVQPGDPLVASLTAVGEMTFRYLPEVAVNGSDAPAAARNRPITLQYAIDTTTKEQTCNFYDQRTRQSCRDGFHIRKDYASNVAARDGRTRAAADIRELRVWNGLLSTSKVIITSKDIEPTSRVVLEPSTRQPAVTQEFTPVGAVKMKDFTSKHMYTIMAIMLDDRILTAPQITGVISNKGELCGGIPTLADARNLAGMLNSGPLPVPLNVVSVERVGVGGGTTLSH